MNQERNLNSGKNSKYNIVELKSKPKYTKMNI